MLQWRSNSVTIPPWNPHIRWYTYRTPLRQLLDANKVACNQKLTQMVKFKLLPVVTLEDHDIDNIAEAIRSCRAASYAAAAMTNLDRIDDAVAPSPPRHYLALVNDNYDGHVKRNPYASVEPADDP